MFFLKLVFSFIWEVWNVSINVVNMNSMIIIVWLLKINFFENWLNEDI